MASKSDFQTDQTIQKVYDIYTELDLYRIMSGFHGAFAKDVDASRERLPLCTPGSIPFWDLHMLQLLSQVSQDCHYSVYNLQLRHDKNVSVCNAFILD